MQKKIEKPYDIVYIKCLEAANNCGFTIKMESLTEGLITYKVKISWLSWGETFVIRITKIDEGLTQVEVGSYNNQIYDWNKNEQNISDFFSMLNSLLNK